MKTTIHLILSVIALMVMALTPLQTWSQTLEGLPQYSVALGGDPTNPSIVNYSGQTIIGHVLRVFYAGNAVPVNFNNFKARGIWMHRPGNEDLEGLRPNHSEIPLTMFFGPTPTIQLKARGNAVEHPIKIVLDSVTFADGHVVGPDEVNEASRLTVRVLALKDFASHVVSGGLSPVLWDEVDRLSSQQNLSGVDHWKVPLARDMRWARQNVSEQEALAMVERVLTIPNIWRTK